MPAQNKTPRVNQGQESIVSPRTQRKDLKMQMNDYLQQLPLSKNLKQPENERRREDDESKKEQKRYVICSFYHFLKKFKSTKRN